MRKINFFSVDSTLKSYTYPIIKIVVCIIISICVVKRDSFFHVEKMGWQFVIGAICVGIGVAIIYCIAISVAEMVIVHDNRHKAANLCVQEVKGSMTYSIDKIVSLVNSNDIIELHAILNGRAIELGSSSDSKPGSSKFFDKLYYIENEEFKNIEDFQNALVAYSNNGQMLITSIDGVSPKYYR